MTANAAVPAGNAVVYDATPSTLPPNMASLGFQATSTSEFGDHVNLAGTNRVLNTVTVTMSDWALYADYSTDARYMGNSATWTHPVTVKVYSSHLGANGVPDTLLATKTENVSIPWRPVADPTPCGTKWLASDGNCYSGKAFDAVFDLSSLGVALPNDVIVGIAFNTQTYGAAPINSAGPYNSLNVGLEGSATVGTDDNADNVFWDTTYPSYTAGFRQDTGWAPNGTVSMKITATLVALVAPPTSKDQCLKSGWMTFNNPPFKNQGDCVSFAATGGKNAANG